MILVDTSVWIEFFKANVVIYPDMVQLLENRFVYVYDLIFAELFRGVRSKKEEKMIESYWQDLPKIKIDDLAILAGKESAKYRWDTQGVGLVDACILVAAQKTQSKIWTLDKKLKKIADVYLC